MLYTEWAQEPLESTWARARYRAPEVVSSDDLRGLVGSGRHDLGASADAFVLLDLVVAGRVRRGLTTVVDTLGLDVERRVTLGLLAGLDTHLRLGTLVTPVTFRPPGITAKAVATLDLISDGRAFCGVGAGWWEREHAAFGLPFPPAAERLDRLEAAIETMRALWAPRTKAYDGQRAALPETTCYPRPVHRVPVIVGGAGERPTLRVAARLADGCNVPVDTVDAKAAVLRRHCEAVGRDPADVGVTVLDLPVVGRDRDDVWQRVERLRGRTHAAAYARRHHAGTAVAHRERYQRLAERGVSTVFVALPDLTRPEDLLDLAPMLP